MRVLICSVAVVAACASNARVRTVIPRAEVGRTWHIVLHQFEVDAGTSSDRYVVYLYMVPPDGSAFVPLRTFAVREACRIGQENRYCADSLALGGQGDVEVGPRPDRASIVEWAVSCGDTRLHVVLDPPRDQITVGRSHATSDLCAITAGAQTFPARGGRSLTAIPWDEADGGLNPMVIEVGAFEQRDEI